MVNTAWYYLFRVLWLEPQYSYIFIDKCKPFLYILVYDLNVLSIVAFREIGRGLAPIEETF
jgi:hypothetical protein